MIPVYNEFIATWVFMVSLLPPLRFFSHCSILPNPSISWRYVEWPNIVYCFTTLCLCALSVLSCPFFSFLSFFLIARQTFIIHLLNSNITTSMKSCLTLKLYSLPGIIDHSFYLSVCFLLLGSKHLGGSSMDPFRDLECQCFIQFFRRYQFLPMNSTFVLKVSQRNFLLHIITEP